jgi:polysaccharide pyruvyl transferase CsaB
MINRILISGYYGYSNSGDDAILTTICRDIKEISSQIDITILSNNPEETVKEYKAKAVNKFHFFEVIKAINKTELVLMGGGSLLQDETSNRSLYYYLFILGYAKLLKKKCMLYANGIGPVYKRGNRWLTKLIVNKVDLITLREKLSYKELKELGIVKPDIHITADPVFTFPMSNIDVKSVFINGSLKPTDRMVGVFFREWKDSKEYISKIAKVCDAVSIEYKAKIVLIPMMYPRDLDVCKKIKDMMTESSVILANKYDAKTIIEIVSKMELVLSMRLHALLYSALSGVPMVGFSYSDKVKYYMNELDLDYIDDINGFLVEDVLGIIRNIYNNYEECKNNIHVKVNKLKRKAEANKLLLEEMINH